MKNELQNVEQGMSNVEVLYFCGSAFPVRHSTFSFFHDVPPFLPE